MKSDRDRDDPPLIQTDLYGQTYETAPALARERTRAGQKRSGVSRRELLKRAGAIGAVVAAPIGAENRVSAATAVQGGDVAAAAAAAPIGFETLTAADFDTLEAVVARLIPADEKGPGAAEAGAAHFIDRALGGSLVAFRETYYGGLSAIDAYAQSRKGARFSQLDPVDQNAILSDIEHDKAPGFGGRSSAFFALLRTHTIQGMFCDPYHGGNVNFVGWDLIGYPGIRLSATRDDQRMNVQPAPVRKSAYDHPMFTKSRKTTSDGH